MSEFSSLKRSMGCKCPRCGEGHLYLKKNDSADGPAVFLIFILGALLVPMALILDAVVEPPLWVHAVLWGSVALGLTVGSLKPLKSLVIGIQYRHRPADWE
jgi:uncharacterized protein (DUF983 family)